MPRVTAYGPPCIMTSSPRTIIVSSRAISSCRASRKASRRLIFGIGLLLSKATCSLGILVGINIFVQLIRGRIGAALRKPYCLLDLLSDALLNRLILGIGENPGLFYMRCQEFDGVTPVRPLSNFTAGAIHLRIAKVMPVEAIRLALQQCW